MSGIKSRIRLGIAVLAGLAVLAAGCRPGGPGPTNENPTLTGLPAAILITSADDDVDIASGIFADPDSGADAITLVLSVGSGTLTATSGLGVTVGGSGTATLSLVGMDVDIDTYLDTPGLIQYAAVTGAAGISLWAAFCNVLVFSAVRYARGGDRR